MKRLNPVFAGTPPANGNRSFVLRVKSPPLDALLSPPQAAAWLSMDKRTLLRLVSKGTIPVVRLNRRVLRFHPRTVLAAIAGGAA